MKNIIALGFFDGVHHGHRQILKQTIKIGSELGLVPCAFTMKEHPKALLTGKAPLKLSSMAERKELMVKLGIRQVFFADFTPEFARMSPESFAKMLKETYDCGAVVYGENYTFGEKGAGWGEYGKQIWKSLGIEPFCMEHIYVNGQIVSSTMIRAMLADGDVKSAAGLLGRNWSVSGKVMQGAQKGRLIGFPTINLIAKKGYVLPGNGVYLTYVHVGQAQYLAITNVGVRPTFYSDSHVFIESHLLNYSGDLYGTSVRVEFVEKIREEHKYPTIEALRQQIDLDKARAIQIGGQQHHDVD